MRAKYEAELAALKKSHVDEVSGMKKAHISELENSQVVLTKKYEDMIAALKK